MALYTTLWLLSGFITAAFLVWSSGDDIEIGDIFFVLFFGCLGPVIATVILVKIIKETEFWKITIYRRKHSIR